MAYAPDGGGGQLVVNAAALHKAADDISQAVSKMRTTLDDLERAAGPLVASWKDGVAKEAYDVRQKGWRTAANDLTNILVNIKQAVIDSAHDYVHTERTNADMFRGH